MNPSIPSAGDVEVELREDIVLAQTRGLQISAGVLLLVLCFFRSLGTDLALFYQDGSSVYLWGVLEPGSTTPSYATPGSLPGLTVWFIALLAGVLLVANGTPGTRVSLALKTEHLAEFATFSIIFWVISLQVQSSAHPGPGFALLLVTDALVYVSRHYSRYLARSHT